MHKEKCLKRQFTQDIWSGFFFCFLFFLFVFFYGRGGRWVGITFSLLLAEVHEFKLYTNTKQASAGKPKYT